MIASLPNASVRKRGAGAGDHKLDMEFIVQLLAHKRLSTVCIWPPWSFYQASFIITYM